MFYYAQIAMYSLLIICGLVLSVLGGSHHFTLGMIGSAAGTIAVYLTIKEKRNQPRRW